MSGAPRPRPHGRWSLYESDPSERPIVPAGTSIEEATARIIDAAGKGKLALLVTDAAGNVIIGLKATGGLTELRPDGEGRWLFAGAFGGNPEILDGSVVLRNRLGLDADREPDDFTDEGDAGRWETPTAPHIGGRQLPRASKALPRRVPGAALERAQRDTEGG